jgi:hypothetical protein
VLERSDQMVLIYFGLPVQLYAVLRALDITAISLQYIILFKPETKTMNYVQAEVVLHSFSD